MSERAQQKERNTASCKLIRSENQKMNGRGRAQKAPVGEDRRERSVWVEGCLYVYVSSSRSVRLWGLQGDGRGSCMVGLKTTPPTKASINTNGSHEIETALHRACS